jgi:cytochrome b6-f complex iron-sulfur subunit
MDTSIKDKSNFDDQSYTQEEGASRPAHKRVSRRNFMKLGLGILSTLGLVEISAAGLIYLQPRVTEEKLGRKVQAGLTKDFPPGSVTEFQESRFYLVRLEDGGFLALYRRCPHLGCTVEWREEKEGFYCPCHGSSFDIYGNFDRAPVPRALDTFKVTIDKGQVVVDTANLIRRESFEADQLVYE